ncbi:hypothetical protein GGF31_005041 [Allomyces arbusculus]|nr:hypothetical protein GGF31_005041 [Allomyces arbusculus]
MHDNATPRIVRADAGASPASPTGTAARPPIADDHAAPTDPAALSRAQLEDCLFADKYFLPGHCFLCAKCLAPDRSSAAPARRRRSAAGPGTTDDHSDGDDDDDYEDADEHDDHARTICPNGWQCPRARQRCSVTGMGASVKLAKLAAPPEDNVYYECLSRSPYLDLARHCAMALKMQEMTWVFCRGPGGCYSVWLRIYKRLKPVSARTASLAPTSPAPTAPAPVRPSRQSASAAVPSTPIASKRERSASPPPPPPRPARPGVRADSAIVSSATPDRAHRDRPPPPTSTTVPAAALVTNHLTLVNAQVALQTQRTYLELRTRMHALGYSREEIDREVAVARGMGMAGMMGMGSAGWKAP